MIIGIISSKDSLALICGAVFSFARKKYSLFYGSHQEHGRHNSHKHLLENGF
jgi:hypothetical protein